MLGKISGRIAQIAPWAIVAGLAYAAAFISPQIEPLELPQPLVESRDMFFDVAVTADNRAMFVGTNGTVLLANIANNTWHRERIANNNLQAIAVDQHGRIVIAGNHGVLFTKQNTASSWQAVELPLPEFANKLTDVTAYNGRFYVVGEMGAIYASTDLQQWHPLSIDEDINLNNIYVAGDTIWIAAEFGTLLHSTNAGETWQRYSLGEESIRAVTFAGPSGVAVGNQGFIAISENSGASWQVLESAGNEHLYDVIWQNAEQPQWLAVGDAGSLLLAANGTRQWQNIRSANSGNQYFARATAFNEHFLIAGRNLGKLKHASHPEHIFEWLNLPNSTSEMFE